MQAEKQKGEKMSNTTWKVESKHHTRTNAERAIARLEAKQAHKPEHKRINYGYESEICTGLWVVINFGGSR